MPATFDHFSNFATSTIAYGAGGVGTVFKSTDASFTVKVGDGAKFPSLTPFMVEASGASLVPELMKCTGIVGDTLTVLRQQEGTPLQTWPVGATVQCVATAGSLSDLWNRVLEPNFNVLDYGATGNGSTDDTAAIQATITAAQASGGIVYFPVGTYLISSTLTVAADNVALVGASWGAQLLAGTSNFTMLQVQGPGGAGNFRYGVRVAELFFNGNNQVGVNAMDLISTYAALVDHVRIRYVLGTGILMDGVSGAFGAYNYIRNCFITDGGATGIGVQTTDSEWLTMQGGHVGYYESSTAIGIQVQNLNCVLQGVQFDYNDTAIQVRFAGRCIIQGCQFDRGWTRFIYLNDTQNCVVSDCFFGVHEGSSTDLIFVDGNGNNGNIVHANTVETSSGWTHFINEGSGIGGTNQYYGNLTGSLPMTLRTGIARNNIGYNPLAHTVTQPSMTSGAVVNASGVDCMVYLVGGSVSQVQVSGANTGLGTGNAFRLPANSSIQLTYTNAPTWQWFGD